MALVSRLLEVTLLSRCGVAASLVDICGISCQQLQLSQLQSISSIANLYPGLHRSDGPASAAVLGIGVLRPSAPDAAGTRFPQGAASNRLHRYADQRQLTTVDKVLSCSSLHHLLLLWAQQRNARLAPFEVFAFLQKLCRLASLPHGRDDDVRAMVQQLVATIAQGVSSYSAKELINCCHACAKLRYWPAAADLVPCVAEHIFTPDQLQTWQDKPSRLAALAWSFSRLGVRDVDVWCKVRVDPLHPLLLVSFIC